MSFFRASPEPKEKAAKAAAKTATAAPTHCSLLKRLCACGTYESEAEQAKLKNQDSATPPYASENLKRAADRTFAADSAYVTVTLLQLCVQSGNPLQLMAGHGGPFPPLQLQVARH